MRDEPGRSVQPMRDEPGRSVQPMRDESGRSVQPMRGPFMSALSTALPPVRLVFAAGFLHLAGFVCSVAFLHQPYGGGRFLVTHNGQLDCALCVPSRGLPAPVFDRLPHLAFLIRPRRIGPHQPFREFVEVDLAGPVQVRVRHDGVGSRLQLLLGHPKAGQQLDELLLRDQATAVRIAAREELLQLGDC
eukprot:gene2073-biopygen13359